MSEQTFAFLGDVCSIKSGGTPTRSNPDYFGGDIPWVKIGDMLQGIVKDTDEKITEAALNKSTAKIFPAGTVLISIFATIGRTAVLGIDAATNQAIAAVIPREPGALDHGYLRRYLDSAVSSLELQASGVAQVNINSTILKGMRIPLPPFAEQKRIAAVLDQADTLRAKRREAIALLDELAQSIFLDMFGDLPASARLSDLAQVQGGLQLSGTRSSRPCEIPYLRVANVYRGYLQLDEIKKLKATPQEIERTRLETGDLLIVEGHGNPNEIGRAALWDGSIENCTHQNHLIRIRVDRQHLIPEYLEMYLNSTAGRRHLLGSANTTSGLNTISTGAVKGNPIPVPSMDQQLVFLGRLGKLRGTMRRHRTHLAALDELFVSLQQRAFAGTLWDHDGEAGSA